MNFTKLTTKQSFASSRFSVEVVVLLLLIAVVLVVVVVVLVVVVADILCFLDDKGSGGSLAVGLVVILWSLETSRNDRSSVDVIYQI